MRCRHSVFVILLPLVLLTCVIAAQTPTPAQLPLDPIRDSGQSVTGAFEGWYPNPDGSLSLLVGYFNRNNKETLDIPIGANNKIEPGNPDQGQPTHFLPRRQWGVFTIVVPRDFGNKKLTWTITANGQTTTIPMNINPLWIVEPFKDAGIGNTPPAIRLQLDGKSFQGPPAGIAATYTAKVSDPVPLDVWVTDDGLVPPERGGGARGTAARATLFWSKYRGPGAVTFSNARPPVNGQDGKASTTARFSIPGEYILRVQANDASGDGGGGFQCCWTNLTVKAVIGASSAQR